MPGYKWNAFIAKVTNKCRYPISQKKTDKIHKSTYGSDGICLFCNILEKENIIYQDDLIAIFKDIKDDAQGHYLAIPKQHIRNLNDLTIEDIIIVERMREIGQRILEDFFPGEKYIFGFHHPPRNSIDHLHMHCIVLPLKK